MGIHIHLWDGFMKYAFEMVSGAMIYITKFQKDWFTHSEVYGGDTQTHIQRGDRISLFLFFFSK
jgi:hypothetical protein